MATAEPTLADDQILLNVPRTSADLVRTTWDYEVRVIYLPDLSAPECAWVSILDRKGNMIGEPITLTVEDGIEAFKNPRKFSNELNDFLARH